MSEELELVSWRRATAGLYAAVRAEAEDDPRRAHELWRHGRDGQLVVDLNFLYHPSCRYNDAWQCPLAPPGNTIGAPVNAGERL
jgi:uncharacterized protein (DUF1684 family)